MQGSLGNLAVFSEWPLFCCKVEVAVLDKASSGRTLLETRYYVSLQRWVPYGRAQLGHMTSSPVKDRVGFLTEFFGHASLLSCDVIAALRRRAP